jgi:hypothetical protein
MPNKFTLCMTLLDIVCLRPDSTGRPTSTAIKSQDINKYVTSLLCRVEQCYSET